MQAPDGSVVRKKALSRPSVLPDRPMRRTRSSIEIQKFAEDDDEDFSDVFGPEESIAEREESERGSEEAGLMLLSRMSGNSWLGDDDDEDDPFASMDPGWDEMDMDAKIARDRHARLAEKIEELVGSLKTTEGEDILADLSEHLVSCAERNCQIRAFELTCGSAGIAMGKPRSKKPHHQCSWVAASIGNFGALYGEE